MDINGTIDGDWLNRYHGNIIQYISSSGIFHGEDDSNIFITLRYP
jgi:hypothetical protein